MRLRGLRSPALFSALVILAAGCGQATSAKEDAKDGSKPAASASATGASPSHLQSVPLKVRDGERLITLTPPGEAYVPSAQEGTDDYHCILLDPGLTKDTWITGVNVLPDNPDVVHHAILFRIEPEDAAKAQAKNAASGGKGWTCFGGAGVSSGNSPRDALNDAPWLAAWAPGGDPSEFPAGHGVKMRKGSLVVMQMHYNLLKGASPDKSSAQLRVNDDPGPMKRLDTLLLVAPIELPCLPEESGPLCARGNAVADVAKRFGPSAIQMVGGLQLLCGGDPFKPVAGPTQHCDRKVDEPITVVSAAGHMHLLGRSISIEANPGSAKETSVLNIPSWNFDDQGARDLAKPLSLKPGDSLRVTCTHDAKLRSMDPSLKGQPARYVVWGEGTSDEMCLGIVIITRD